MYEFSRDQINSKQSFISYSLVLEQVIRGNYVSVQVAVAIEEHSHSRNFLRALCYHLVTTCIA